MATKSTPWSKAAQHGLIEQTPLALLAAHDESGLYKCDRYFSTGFIFVESSRLGPFSESLRAVREHEDYWGEIHYNRLRNIEGDFAGKFRTSMGWMDCLEREMVSGGARVSVLTVDTHASTFKHLRFRSHPNWAYNRFTRIALEGGVQWLFRGKRGLAIRLLTDGKSERAGGDDEEPNAGTDFAHYLPLQSYWRIRQQPSWPDVKFDPDVVEDIRPGKTHYDCSFECELVQVADLVVSSVAAAIRGPGQQPAKIAISKPAATWIQKTSINYYRKRKGGGALHRKFSSTLWLPGAVPAFPDPIPLAVDPTVSEKQEALF